MNRLIRHNLRPFEGFWPQNLESGGENKKSPPKYSIGLDKMAKEEEEDNNNNDDGHESVQSYDSNNDINEESEVNNLNLISNNELPIERQEKEEHDISIDEQITTNSEDNSIKKMPFIRDNNHQQQNHKRSPFASSKTQQLAHGKLSTDRLTLLQDPGNSQLAFGHSIANSASSSQPIGHNKQISNSILSAANNRETLLPLDRPTLGSSSESHKNWTQETSSRVELQEVGVSHSNKYLPAEMSLNAELPKWQPEQQQQAQIPRREPIVGAGTFGGLVLFAMIIILYLLSRRRHRFVASRLNLRQSKTDTDLNIESVIRKFCFGHREDREMCTVDESRCLRSTGSGAGVQVSSANQNCGGGERIRLVERRQRNADGSAQENGEDDDDNNNEIEASVDGIQSAPAEEIETCGRKPSKIVILQRRLAKHSLVVAAKSTKPKVRLITARVRRFIDEEADELRHKADEAKVAATEAASSENQSWQFNFRPISAQVCAFFLTLFASKSRAAGANKEPTDEANELELRVSCPMGGATQQKEEAATKQIEPQEDQSHSARIRDSNEDERRAPEVGAMLSCPPIECMGQKLMTPSPILNDGCSSISACSLFSPSPIDSSLPVCGCGSNRLTAGYPFAAMDYRSKSQGQSPASRFDSGSYRPCCASVSPSALNARAASCYHHAACHLPSPHAHHQSHPLHPLPHPHPTQQQPLEPQRLLVDGRKLSATSHEAATETMNRGPSFEPLATTGQLPAGGSANANSTNRIRRQYENYYDDEQEDAYRRLTASIGMDFGLSFGHVPQMQPPVGAAVNIDHLLQFQQPVYAAEYPDGAHRATGSLCMMSGVHNNQPEGANLAATVQCDGDGLQVCRCGCRAPQQVASGALQLDQRTAQSSCQETNSVSGQCLFKWEAGGGSAGELQSSTSTSLGGSDSGFVSCANNFGAGSSCPNPGLCLCQAPPSRVLNLDSAASNIVHPPMSILIQQPSVGSTPPPPHPTANSEPQVSGQLPLGCLNMQPAAACFNGRRGEIATSPMNSAPGEQAATWVSSGGGRCTYPPSSCKLKSPVTRSSRGQRWRHRRRFSAGKRIAANLMGYQCKESSFRARRMSIAGDRVSSLTSGHLFNQAAANADGCRVAFQHRASFASDGSWLVTQPQPLMTCGQFYRSSPGQQQAAGGHQWRRPSDASSIYEPQFCNLKQSSNYSSSNGSSSGIGFSGSCCTNTPTAIFPPFGGFSTFAASRADYPPQAAEWAPHLTPEHAVGQQTAAAIAQSVNYQLPAAGCQRVPNTNPLARGETAAQQCSLQPSARNAAASVLMSAASCPNRKFSLPVQLESPAGERLSPNRTSRLLFEKNLQRVDSASLSHPDRCSPAEATRSINRELGGRRTIDSRRSSQTITRQSSFWLEDNSVDSILSLNTSGNFTGQQSDELGSCSLGSRRQSLMPEESAYLAADQNDPTSEQRLPAASDSQRPSLGSLVQSGDSIESVKQRPPPPAPIGSAPGDAIRGVEDLEATSSNEFSSGSRRVKGNEEEEGEETSGMRKLASCSSTSSSSSESRRRSNYNSFFHHKNRLSSTSSTSSSTSSPSPDFGLQRPSARLLGLASRSGNNISKRHFGQRFKSRKLIRGLGACSLEATGSNQQGASKVAPQHQYSAPSDSCNQLARAATEPVESSSTDLNKEKTISVAQFKIPSIGGGEPKKNEGNKETELGVGREFNLVAPIARPISDLNSSSLERQCRDLWKLRATLHEDSRFADNWTNFHQRLNRRYDSGYKSIENQTSSSLEGNAIIAATNIQATAQSETTNQAPQTTTELATDRPQSGCSNYIIPQEKEQSETLVAECSVLFDEDQVQVSPSSSSTSDRKETDELGINHQLFEEPQEPLIQVEAKLSDLNLEEEQSALVLEQVAARSCDSRSSKSSNEEEKSRDTSSTQRH